MFVNLFLSSTAFSQKSVLIDADTNICFSFSQAKYLLKQLYLVNEQDTLLKISKSMLELCNEKSIIYEKQIMAYEEIVKNQEKIYENSLALNNQINDEIKSLKKEISKHKFRGWTYIFGGFVSTAFVSYLYISK